MRQMIIFLLAVLLWGSACSHPRVALPEFGTLPDFRLMNQQGKEMGLKDLQGKIWVADFIFTSCAGTCPMLTQRMKRVQQAITEMGEQGAAYHIVSFSVDPERDTPERLAQYARDFDAHPEHWSFLTGPLDQVSQTVVQGFKIAMGKAPREGDPANLNAGEVFDILHGEKFVLVDGKGIIRGYYDSEGEGITQLIADMKSL
jgi:protein SCO1